MSIYEPKKDLFDILSGISTSLKVYQSYPEVSMLIPCLTFHVSQNIPKVTLNKTIGYQDIEVIIDIWGTTSKESGTYFKALVDTMLANNYVLYFSSDIPNQDKEAVSHITTRFKLLK